MTQHAKNYPPSGAARYVHCPGSVLVYDLYEHDESDASLKGTYEHDRLELSILFGVQPNTADPDLNENISVILDHLASRRQQLGPSCRVYSEQRLDIPDTGEFGTADIVIDADTALELEDYKGGYVPVELFSKDGEPNEQLMSYLTGAIAKYGPRQNYKITIHQPNASHIDGPIRSANITPQQVEDFRHRLRHAVASDYFAAGWWCKKTYCPHRASCVTFNEWRHNQERDMAYFSSEVNAISDEQLAAALDHAEMIQGMRDEYRKEAMRRMLNLDRKIKGYKIVKGKKDRDFAPDAQPKAKALMMQYGATEEDMYNKTFVSVKGMQDFVKKLGAQVKRGYWQEIWKADFSPLVREYVGGLTLERATDGRPAHRRGSEFGALLPPLSTDTLKTLTR